MTRVLLLAVSSGGGLYPQFMTLRLDIFLFYECVLHLVHVCPNLTLKKLFQFCYCPRGSILSYKNFMLCLVVFFLNFAFVLNYLVSKK